MDAGTSSYDNIGKAPCIGPGNAGGDDASHCEGYGRRRDPIFSAQREYPFLEQPFAEFDAVFVVDMEENDRDSANRRATHEAGTLPAEMPSPCMSAGVEQRRELARRRFEATEVRSLERITIIAT